MSVLKQQWDKLAPGRKRAVVLAAAGVALVGLLYLVIPEDTGGNQANRRREAISSIMVENNTRSVTIDGLAGQIRQLEASIAQLAREREADKRTQIGALEAQAAQLRREIQDARGQSTAERRNTLREIERRLSELTGMPLSALTVPDVPQEPPRAAEPPPADPVSFGAQPPRPAAPPASNPAPVPAASEAPTSPLGDLSPAAVFGGARPRTEPAVIGSPPRAGAAPAVAPAGAAPSVRQVGSPAGPIRYIAPPAPPVEQQNTPVPARPRNEATLPAGSILSGVVLAGFDAPTSRNARRDPLPALVRLNDLAILPNRFRADVRECFLLVSGFGDLSSERAYMRGETLSCILNDGTVIQERIQAYATGEDGKTGVRGRLVQKQGEFVGRALLVGLMQGVAQAFASSGRGVTIGVQGGGFSFDNVQDNFGPGLARGGGQAFDRIARFYLDQAGDLFPVIEISAGRRVDVILTGGITLRLPQ